MNQPTELKFQQIDVTAADLPLHCPMPSMKLWNTHPRVFIDVRGAILRVNTRQQRLR